MAGALGECIHLGYWENALIAQAELIGRIGRAPIGYN